MAARKKRAAGAKRFSASLTLENVELVRAKSAIKLLVYERGEKLGELQIGHGSAYWWGHKRKKPKRFWWGRLAAILNKYAYEGERL